VTIHSFTLLVSSRPIIVAFVRCRDMVFSKRTQKTSKWNDLKNDYKKLSNVIKSLCSLKWNMFDKPNHSFEMCDRWTKHMLRQKEERKNKINTNLRVPTAFRSVMMQGI
jgi:hypothetical protein